MAIANKFALALAAALTIATPTIAFAQSTQTANETFTPVVPEGFVPQPWIDTGYSCAIPGPEKQYPAYPEDLLIA